MQMGTSQRALTIHNVPHRIVVLTAVASVIGLVSAVMQAWPLWATAVAVLLPWLPILALETVWTYRHYAWLALFYVLVITQGGHVVEHIAQMIQIHILGLRGPAARGIFGALDIEWVHFLWNSWVLVAVGLLVWRFPRNPWLWVTFLLAGWHELEHIAIMTKFLRTGQEGTPGLLASGGLIGGGLPLRRPDLHFVYNIVETTPLVVAFAYQLKYSYDEWLKRALPALAEPLLAQATRRLQAMRFSPGQTIVREGDLPDRFYIIAQGEVTITRGVSAAGSEHLGTLSAGQFFGEVGLLAGIPRTASVHAKTAVEALALDRDAFLALVEHSAGTHEQLAEVVRCRLR